MYFYFKMSFNWLKLLPTYYELNGLKKNWINNNNSNATVNIDFYLLTSKQNVYNTLIQFNIT